MTTVTSILPRIRESNTASAAGAMADRLGLSPGDSAAVIATARVLVRHGCSAAWALTTARRHAMRVLRHGEGAA